MPSLNRRQFWQEPLEGWNQSLPSTSMKGYRPPPSGPPPIYDPGPDTKRGSIGEGQRMLNFDEPDYPLETSTAGLVPVDEGVDPAWDRTAWRYGGANRQIVGDDVPLSEPTSPEGEDARRVVRAWESAPLQTIGPDVEIRTGQGTAPAGPLDPQVDLDSLDRVDELRHAEVFENEDGTPQNPWIAEVEGKRYLLEGHHRATAARTRGTGEFDAHVIRGGNWGQIEQQMYDGPWKD